MSLIRPRTEKRSITVRYPHPIGESIASRLAHLHGRGIKGHIGTVRYGAPGLATQHTKFKGYVFPPQMFIGWNPSHVAAGTVRNQVQRLPSTAAPTGTYSPIMAALANVTSTRPGPWSTGGQ